MSASASTLYTPERLLRASEWERRAWRGEAAFLRALRYLEERDPSTEYVEDHDRWVRTPFDPTRLVRADRYFHPRVGGWFAAYSRELARDYHLRPPAAFLQRVLAEAASSSSSSSGRPSRRRRVRAEQETRETADSEQEAEEEEQEGEGEERTVETREHRMEPLAPLGSLESTARYDLGQVRPRARAPGRSLRAAAEDAAYDEDDEDDEDAPAYVWTQQ